jgi:hypothetical protein
LLGFEFSKPAVQKPHHAVHRGGHEREPTTALKGGVKAVTVDGLLDALRA